MAEPAGTEFTSVPSSAAVGMQLPSSLDLLPPLLRSIILELRTILANRGIISAILVGSASRGEMDLCERGGTLKVRSDLELYVACRSPRRMKHDLAPLIRTLENEYVGHWPEFHIDISWISLRRFCRLPHWLRHFELKANGVTLAGRDIRDLVPEVGLHNLDWRELNEVVLWRLLGLVARLPADWLAGRAPSPPGLEHAMARSLLDVTTWGLPGMGILLPTFRQRVERWAVPATQERTSTAGLIDGKRLTACMECRGQTECGLSADELLDLAVTNWTSAYDIVTGRRLWDHHGAGAGFRSTDWLRRARAAFRTSRVSVPLALHGIRKGSHALAAAAAAGVARAALELRTEGGQRMLEEVAESLGVCSRASNPVDTWRGARNLLIQYIDRSLGRHEWSRLIPTSDRT